jgi:hypothetical protein
VEAAEIAVGAGATGAAILGSGAAGAGAAFTLQCDGCGADDPAEHRFARSGKVHWVHVGREPVTWRVTKAAGMNVAGGGWEGPHVAPGHIDQLNEAVPWECASESAAYVHHAATVQPIALAGGALELSKVLQPDTGGEITTEPPQEEGGNDITTDFPADWEVVGGENQGA